MSRALRWAVLSTLACAAPGGAWAGDRRADVLAVNMTPDAASSDASRACVQGVVRALAADYTLVERMGETALRAAAGEPKPSPFMAWSLDAMRRAQSAGGKTRDLLVLVDCRPEEKRFDARVAPPALGVADFELRGVELTPAVVRLLAEAILRRSWLGFSP